MRKYMNKLFKNKKGFTLVELIVVIAIMAILAGMTVPSVLNYIKSYKKVSAKTDTESIFRIAVAAIPQYKMDIKDQTLDNKQKTAIMVDRIKERASSSEYDIVAYNNSEYPENSPSKKSVILVQVSGDTVYVAFFGKGWTRNKENISADNLEIKDEDGTTTMFRYSQTIWE